jgi:hypothetical protein
VVVYKLIVIVLLLVILQNNKEYTIHEISMLFVF